MDKSLFEMFERHLVYKCRTLWKGLIHRHPSRLLVTSMKLIGLDIRKKTISHWVNDISGKVLSEAKIQATRRACKSGSGRWRSPGRWRWKPPCLRVGSTTTFERTRMR
jgi:hypothetical protein